MGAILDHCQLVQLVAVETGKRRWWPKRNYLEITVNKVLAVHEIKGRGDLGGHAFGVHLAQAPFGDVGGQVAKRGELLCEIEVALALERHVICVECRRVWT